MKYKQVTLNDEAKDILRFVKYETRTKSYSEAIKLMFRELREYGFLE